jgi:hypothetical protein
MGILTLYVECRADLIVEVIVADGRRRLVQPGGKMRASFAIRGGVVLLSERSAEEFRDALHEPSRQR